MSIFREYECQMEKDFDIMKRQHDIDIDHFYNDYKLESTLAEINGSVFTEAEASSDKKENSKFVTFVKRIVASIQKFISDGLEMVQNMFSKKEHLDPETFMKSQTGQIMLEYDVKKVQKQVEDEVLKGRKIVQLISKATKVDDKMVADFVDGAAKGIQKYGKVAIKTTVAFGMYKTMSKSLDKSKQVVADTEADALNCEGNPEKEHYVTMVLKGMNSIVSDGLKVFSMLATNLDKVSK